MARLKHQWVNKRTPKGEKPVREWIECKVCGEKRPTEKDCNPK